MNKLEKTFAVAFGKFNKAYGFALKNVINTANQKRKDHTDLKRNV